MNSTILSHKTISWLSEDNNAPVRNLARQHLLGKKPIMSEIDEVNQYLPIKGLLSLMKSNGSWSSDSPYKKYLGDYWQVIFLSELQANPSDQRIQKASAKILEYQLPNGSFPMKPGTKSSSVLCLTANILRSLIYFGWGQDDRVQKGMKLVTKHLAQNLGVLCSGMNYSLLGDCQQALPKILAMYAMLKKEERTLEMRQTISIVVEKIAKNRIHRYLPEGTKELRQLMKHKKTREIPLIIEDLQKNPENMRKNMIKKGWLKFGFPHTYTSDTLEVLYYLSKLDIPLQDGFKEGLDWVIKKMTSSGVWLNETKIRNPMYVAIESKNSPSKWITFRAYYVLKKYGNLQIELG